MKPRRYVVKKLWVQSKSRGERWLEFYVYDRKHKEAVGGSTPSEDMAIRSCNMFNCVEVKPQSKE